MTEQVKINPDLLIILVGSVINKFMSAYQGDYKECRAVFPVDQFISDLNKITQEYTSKFPNDDIHFPQIDLKLLSFIITRTLYHKFVTVTQDHVEIDVLPHVYENFLKNIVATSTLRYAKYLLKGAKDLYEEDKKNGNKPEEQVATKEPQREVQEKVEAQEEAVEANKETVNPSTSEKETPKEQEVTNEKEVSDEKAEPKESEREDEDKMDIDEEPEKTEETEKPEEKVEEKTVEEEVVSEEKVLEDKAEPEEKDEESVEVGKEELEEKEEVLEEPAESDKMEVDKEEETVKEDEQAEAEKVETEEPQKDKQIPEIVVEQDEESDKEQTKEEASAEPESEEKVEESVEESKVEEKPEQDESKEPPKEETAEEPKVENPPSEPEELPVGEPKEEEKPEESVEPEEEQVQETLQSRKRSRSPAPGQQHKRFQNIAVNLLNSIQEHRFSSPFLQPVNPKDAPDYHNIIFEPRDLKNILKAVKSKRDPPTYLSVKELERDIMLMFANCIMYNRSGDDLIELTKIMKSDASEIFKLFEEAEEEIK
ncbi:hypothetical protein Cantr_02136 [Candida viswanathii]|uniref:Bromo domain-containing protein n=1 Tax=Candida viswanathii TaxID=5486 RepID=A0A367YN22_9ASCO|nr:hypothetical protein Cantr_02136 [Candida viswanathii]